MSFWVNNMRKFYWVNLFVLMVILFSQNSITEAALPKIDAVRWAAQPDSVLGEKVWRYVLDFSEPVKKKPEIKGDKIFLPGVDPKTLQGKKYGSGTIPKMQVSNANKVVYLEIAPSANQNLRYKVFALAADPSKGKKERIVIEIIEGKDQLTLPVPTVKSISITESKYSVQKITIDLKQATKTTYTVDDTESGVMVVTLPNTDLGITNQSHTIDNGESVTRVRINRDGKNWDIVMPMSTYFRQENMEVKITQGNERKGTSTVVDILIRQKLPDYEYSLSAGVKGKTIVIDPGHGGSDPGAVGPKGTQEKNVTLAIAKKLGAQLEAAGATVFFTRTVDVDVAKRDASGAEELHKRIEVAHNRKADIFVSIHADASVSSEAGGTTTYYYVKTPYDLKLAQAVQRRVSVASGLLNRGTKQSGFYVNKKSWIPSILLETAFISNPNEEKLLGQAEFQEKIADGLFKGIVDFYKEVGGGK